MKMFNELMQISFNKDVIWDSRSAEGYGAFIMLQQYMHGAAVQWERIRGHREGLEREGAIETPNVLRNLFLDIHYYFICAGRIEKLIGKLSELDDGVARLKDIYRSNRNLFRPYNDARMRLDEIEGSLTGRFISDFIKVRGNRFTIGGYPIDIDSTSLNILRGMYDEVVGALLMSAR